jgi:hypothetical protein
VVALLSDSDRDELWCEALLQVMDLAGANGRVSGRAARILVDRGRIPTAEVRDRLSQMATPGTAPSVAARWLEGFLGGSAQILIHDDALWALVDGWVSGLKTSEFDDLLPLLRRTFAELPPPERRRLAERAEQGERRSAPAAAELDAERAQRVLPLIRRLLGLEEGA